MSNVRDGSDFKWDYRGTAWVFGDNIGVDGDLMPLEFALKREIRPKVLKNHVFAGIDKHFSTKAKPGDIVVAGRRFAQGNPHIQGLLGLVGLGLGLVVESIPSGSYRNAINAGLPILARCANISKYVATGDELQVDFVSGRVENLTSGWSETFPAAPPELRAIVAQGGWASAFRRRLAGGDPQFQDSAAAGKTA